MKNIKKVIISIVALSLLVSVSSFASLTFNATRKARETAFIPTSSHRMAMGGAGLGLAGFYDSYLYNPANITKDGFKLVLPSLTLTVNNVYNLMNPETGDDAITIAQRIGSDDNAPVQLATLMLKSIPYGHGEIMTLDTNIGFKTRNFGLDLAVQEKLRSYNGGGDFTTASAISQTTVAATAGLGFNIPLGDLFSIDLGATGGFNYKVYSVDIGANEAIALMSDDDIENSLLRGNIAFASGYALPLAIGANFNLPLGLTISGVGRNFNGNYEMTTYENLASLVKHDEMLTSMLGENALDYGSGTDSTMTTVDVEIPWRLDLGLTFAPSTPIDGLLKPAISLDFVDSFTLVQDLIEGEKTATQLKSDALSSLNAGAQVRLFSFVDVRAGISQGYKSIGVGLDLLVIHLDAAYYWREYGDVLGQNPSDSLSVRFSLISK